MYAGYIHPAPCCIGDLRSQVGMIYSNIKNHRIAGRHADVIGLGHHSYFIDRHTPMQTPTVHETWWTAMGIEPTKSKPAPP